VASQGAAARTVGWTRPDARESVTGAAARIDYRRFLQLCLAGIWLLDGVLQYQSVMFNRGFGQMLAQSAAGNPAVIADPITWAARIISGHPSGTNAAFASIQVALGLGIAWRRSVRPALAASIVWSVAVWWFGEGLGGVLTGATSPVNDAPGAVILYALAAVLLWPAAGAGAFVAARPAGARVARGLWVLLWGSLAYFAVLPVNRTPQALHDMIIGMAAGEPGWLASAERGAAGLVAHQGLAASIALAVALAAIALGGLLPAPGLRAAVVAALIVTAVIWVFGQDLGGLLAGGATDVNTGPLLALIALAYWPRRAPVPSPPVPSPAGAGPGVTGATGGAA
jgi:hypothetical protein